MTIAVVTEDRDALPAELLPIAKQHCRVDHSNDDDLLISIIRRAIARFQSDNEVTLNPTAVVWTPALAEFTSGMATLPVVPSSLATPIDGYSVVLKWYSIHGIPIQALQGTAANGMTVDLLCGYPSADDLPPDVLDEVLRSTAHLYEHREILVPGGRDHVSPDLATSAAWWKPRV